MVGEVDQNPANKRKGKKIGFKSVTKEKIEKVKKKSLKIVESLLESSVSEELLISSCSSINQDDYLDVIEERNILHLCGYPLCSKELKIPKQKYHISLKTNKVYDITERKCFCSDRCYKASNFLKAQLCTIPIWLKDKDEDKPIQLLCTTLNSGSAGEEVDLGHVRMTPDDIELIPEKTSENSSENVYSPYVSDDLETCAAKFDNLEISEKCTYSINPDSLESTLILGGNSWADASDDAPPVKCDGDNIKLITEKCVEKKYSPKQPVKQCPYIDSDDDDNDKFLPDYNKYESLISNNKYMPVIPKTEVRKAVLIDPAGNPDASRLSSAAEKTASTRGLIQNTLMTWITLETYQILLGDKFESLKNEILQRTEALPSNELQTSSAVKLKAMKESYTKICLKLEKEEAIELNNQSSIESKVNKSSCCDKAQEEEELPESNEALKQLKVSMFYKGEIGLPETAPPPNKNKSVRKQKPTPGKSSKKDSTRKVPIKVKEMEPVTASTSREGSVLPVVESLSQNTIRRQIVADRLKLVYLNILPVIGLHYRDIREDFRLLISTFSLSSTNISFKPSEWKMIAVILFRMMETKLTTEKVWAQEKCWELLEAKLISFDISLDQIDGFLASVIDNCHFKKLVLGY